MSDREQDTTEVFCMDCGWEGEVRECVHGYQQGLFETEPWDYCQECGSPNLTDPAHYCEWLAEQAVCRAEHYRELYERR